MLRLRPLSNYHQQIDSWSIHTPKPIFQTVDWFGNCCDCLVMDDENINNISITAVGVVDTNANSVNYEIGNLPLAYYLNSTSYTQFNENMLKILTGVNTLNLNFKTLELLSEQILLNVPYVRGMTNSLTTAKDSIDISAGVCQDHSHIMLAIARHLKLPARYVSGYLYTPDTEHVASHAWVEIWLENAWHSFDISNQCVAAESHVILAYGLDYMDATPIRGSRIGGGFEYLDTNAFVSNQ